MEIFYTIIIILGAILVAPLVAFASVAIIGGAILGLLFSFIVALVGVEMSMPVFITCIISGVVVAVSAGVGAAVEKQNKNDKD